MIERTKSFIRSVFPCRVRIYRRLRGFRADSHAGAPSMESIFSGIYLNNSWSNPESVSGRGSTLAHTEMIRKTLPDLLAHLHARSLLDAPCGDFNWMQYVDLGGIQYTGADVV